MALSIKNDETEALVRELARRTGSSVTGAITDAVRSRLDHLDALDSRRAVERLERMRVIASDAAPRWPDSSPADASAWLYDERGLPA